MPRMTRRADRLFQIAQILRGRRLTTAAMLADRLGVSERTVYRDIRDLSISGVPIEGEAGIGYRMRAGFDLAPDDNDPVFEAQGQLPPHDEDYAETPAAVRDRTLMIPGSGGVRIPLRPDFFLFPKIIAEHTYQLITDKGYEDGAKFRKSMFDALVNATLSPTPIPQIVKPALEVAINYDFFQGKPLIGTFEKNKDLERQFRDTTSELAKLFGQTGMVSPIAVDHLIRGMLGSFGGLMLYGTNMFLHSDPDVPRPEMSANEMLAALPGTAGFLKRPQESALKNDFFVLRDAVEKAANTFNDIKTRSPEGIEAFLEDEKNAIRLGMAKGVDKINRHLSDIRRRMTIITNMPESQMPADEKAENIRELRELEREILRSVNVKELREMAKI
jgi:biotin operon repressor